MQEAVVALVVACAFWAVARRYLPKSVRRAIRSWSVRVAKRLGWHRLADRLSVAEEKGGSCSDGCGSCGGCGRCRGSSGRSGGSCSRSSRGRSAWPTPP